MSFPSDFPRQMWPKRGLWLGLEIPWLCCDRNRLTKKGSGKKFLEILESQKIHQFFFCNLKNSLPQNMCVFLNCASSTFANYTITCRSISPNPWPATEERGSIPRISEVGAAHRWPRYDFCGQYHCSTAQQVVVTVEDGEFRHSGGKWL